MRLFFFMFVALPTLLRRNKETRLFFYPRTQKLWMHAKYEQEKHVAWVKTHHNQLS